MRLEQVMALQPQELVGELVAASAGDLGHGDLEVVVADPPRDAAEEFEGPDMPLRNASVHSCAGKGAAGDGAGVRQAS